jgi:Skp family chaperone for outer membrane proteins
MLFSPLLEKNITMKLNVKNYTKLISSFILIVFLASCTQTSQKEDKELVNFEAEKEEINEFLTEKKSELDDAIDQLEKTAEVEGERASENVEMMI